MVEREAINVLLVESDVVYQDKIESLLSNYWSEGLQVKRVILAASIKGAERKLRNEFFNMILVGGETLKGKTPLFITKLRKQSEYKEVPILYRYTNGSDDFLFDGFHDVLPFSIGAKPVDILETLPDIFRKIIKAKKVKKTKENDPAFELDKAIYTPFIISCADTLHNMFKVENISAKDAKKVQNLKDTNLKILGQIHINSSEFKGVLDVGMLENTFLQISETILSVFETQTEITESNQKVMEEIIATIFRQAKEKFELKGIKIEGSKEVVIVGSDKIVKEIAKKEQLRFDLGSSEGVISLFLNFRGKDGSS